VAKQMIEQYVSDRQCRRCFVFRPLTEFSPDKSRKDGYQLYCKPCRRAYANRCTAEGVRSDYKPKRKPIESPTAWLVPADPRGFAQQLLAATQQRWRYEVEPVQNLTWRIAA
jgi:hypothetical protein